MTDNRLLDELLLRGLDDWVMAAEVASLARSVGGAATDTEVRDMAVEAISAVVEDGLMQVGDVSDGGFFEWDMKPEDAVQRVASEWRALQRSPDIGEVCWLSNTPAGDARAKALGN